MKNEAKEEAQRAFGRRFSEFLDHYRLTPADVADRLRDRAGAKYYKYRDGVALPGMDTLARLLEAFPRLNPIWLMRGVGPLELESGGSVSDDETVKLREELAGLRRQNKIMRERLFEFQNPELFIDKPDVKIGSDRHLTDEPFLRIPFDQRRSIGFDWPAGEQVA